LASASAADPGGDHRNHPHGVGRSGSLSVLPAAPTVRCFPVLGDLMRRRRIATHSPASGRSKLLEPADLEIGGTLHWATADLSPTDGEGRVKAATPISASPCS
jgi:hypothetical protein